MIRDLCSQKQLELPRSIRLLYFVAHQLLHEVHIVCVSFYELKVIVGKPQEAHELCDRSGGLGVTKF